MRRKQQRQQQQPVRGVVGSGGAAPVKRACTAATLYALAADPVPGWAAHACVHARARPAPSLPQQHVTCDAPHTLAPCACLNHTPSPAPCRPLPPAPAHARGQRPLLACAGGTLYARPPALGGRAYTIHPADWLPQRQPLRGRAPPVLHLHARAHCSPILTCRPCPRLKRTSEPHCLQLCPHVPLESTTLLSRQTASGTTIVFAQLVLRPGKRLGLTTSCPPHLFIGGPDDTAVPSSPLHSVPLYKPCRCAGQG